MKQGTRTPRASYPHVTSVPDRATQESLRLLWERLFTLDDLVTSLEQQVVTLSSDLDATKTTLDTVQTEVRGVLPMAAGPTTTATGAGGGPGSPVGVWLGCDGAPATGHVTGALTEDLARRIICGTGQEWSALLGTTVNVADRKENAELMVRRMIWHLNLAGFTAGRQRNPSTVISLDKLTVTIDGELRAFDVLTNYEGPIDQPMAVSLLEVFPADYVADAGLAD